MVFLSENLDQRTVGKAKCLVCVCSCDEEGEKRCRRVLEGKLVAFVGSRLVFGSAVEDFETAAGCGTIRGRDMGGKRRE